jgi:hypothetical protein
MDAARFTILTLGLVLAAASGCGGSARDSETGAARAWMRQRPTDVDWGPGLHRSRYQFVDSAMRTDAILILARRPWIELTEDQATGLVAQGFAAGTTGRPFLLRALRGTHGTSGIAVYERAGGEVWTSAGTLSAYGPVPILRWPVVAWLDHEPAEVYPTFEVAR